MLSESPLRALPAHMRWFLQHLLRCNHQSFCFYNRMIHKVLCSSAGSNCPRDWKSHQLQLETLGLTIFPSAKCASGLRFGGLVVNTAVQSFMILGFLLLFYHRFPVSLRSHLIYSFNTADKTMLFFLGKSVMRTVLFPLRGQCMSLWYLDKQKNRTFKMC